MNYVFNSGDGPREAIIRFLKQALEKHSFDFLMIPLKGPDEFSYSWVLMKDPALLEKADPLPPVMTVQGGHALSSITKHGSMGVETAAVMRPCEIRAAVELAKLKQIDLEDMTLISIDCPGAVPLTEYMNDPENNAAKFGKLLQSWDVSDDLRPACRYCHRFSLPELKEKEGPVPGPDLHIGIGEGNENLFFIPATPKGEKLLKGLDLSPADTLTEWKSKTEKIRKKKLDNKNHAEEEWGKAIQGSDRFADAFDACINCHNCMRVCPVCYCQQCYFDSRNLKLKPEDYLERAEKRGALRFPLDTLLFQLGRMSHMLLSCVACGACEDACPMNVPVGQIFTVIGSQVQADFGYSPGINRREPLPLQDFREDEFLEVETPTETEGTPARGAE
jgi:formate dehydrogenase (coenzyme F420) beta subunit